MILTKNLGGTGSNYTNTVFDSESTNPIQSGGPPFTGIYKPIGNLKDLYNVLICQILQRKVNSAEKTINLILEKDFSNGNAQLAKSIINIYLLDKKDARISLNNAKSYDKSEESTEILKIIEGLTYFLELKFINAFKILT